MVVTSDHGFSIGEHARVGKSNLKKNDCRRWPLYPEISHIPFLIAGSDVPKRRKCKALAQPIDILPTVCELAGVDADYSEEPDGMSFAPAIFGKTETHRCIAISSCHLSVTESGDLPEGACTPFITDGELGYVPFDANGGEGLYLLDEAPLAKKNKADEAPELSERMRFAIKNAGYANALSELIT